MSKKAFVPYRSIFKRDRVLYTMHIWKWDVVSKCLAVDHATRDNPTATVTNGSETSARQRYETSLAPKKDLKSRCGLDHLTIQNNGGALKKALTTLPIAILHLLVTRETSAGRQYDMA